MLGAIGLGISVRRVVVRAGAWILLSCLAGALCEQPEDAHITARSDPAASAPADADRTFPKIRVNSDLVIIPVTVTDGKGRVVNGLQKEHFKLYEDKVEHAIAQFAAEDAPVSIGLVFDAKGGRSGSCTPERLQPRGRILHGAVQSAAETCSQHDTTERRN